MHCRACERTVAKVISKCKGVETFSTDMMKHRVVVKGRFNPDMILKKLKKKTGKRVEVVIANNNNEDAASKSDDGGVNLNSGDGTKTSPTSLICDDWGKCEGNQNKDNDPAVEWPALALPRGEITLDTTTVWASILYSSFNSVKYNLLSGDWRKMTSEDQDQKFVPQKKKSPSDEEKEKRRKKIVPGSLMKAEMRPGGGTVKPVDGDQVIYHCTVRTLDGVIVESTRSEHGGKGNLVRQVLGKSKMILGLLEGIPTMLKGEVAMFKMKSELHYGEDDCPVATSESFPKHDELHFEIELIDFFKVKVITEDLGVMKKVVNEGEGWETPREPYEIKAWISARTSDGKLILSHTQGEPFFFTFGKAEVPKGLEIGIGTMARGEKAILYVSNRYLTQSPFMPVIEGYEEVQFEVELVHFIQVRDMLGDGRLIKRRIHDGRGEFPMDCPLHDSLLRVHYKGMLLNEERTVFYDTRVDNDGQHLEFSSGEGLVPEGLEMCVRLMLPGEIALVTCPPDYAYDKFTRPATVPEGAHVQWEIELLGFEMPKDWTGLSFNSIMEEAEKIKNTGNRLFKEGKFELAKANNDCHLQVLREFNHVNPQDDGEGKIFLNSRNSLHLNVAACYLKMGECKKSIEACDKVLDANPVHVKALYRRGMAYMSAGDFEEARSDFKKMITIDKSLEPDATAALKKLKQKEQEVETKAKRQFKGLFDKKPGEIADVGTDTGNDEKAENENHKSGDEAADSVEDEAEDVNEAAPPPPRGLFSRIWPVGSRLFSALGLQRCSIL
ncbi:Peptidyl-prolyl cis-trans isomerase [Macleaya cordata]|uniref:peptidylprolyl isomerase n=1 Tax=Macleaya cordata TaxID=56857 RepID=A0A200R4U2_MACCD|nr:Peptidyl-prolyl cis-trans isomerase [Macleaya cordata]